ncbi:MAG: hypothetical protein LBV04_07665 [Deferribacteraceae bacterium]|jgi:hypothetical protein|nr:hypothetical protein [Deferribacteraceae bacterium]
MYKLVDYWNNGNIDVMVGDELLAEVTPVSDGFMLHFAINVQHPNVETLEQWVHSHISAMMTLTKSTE